VRENKGDYGGDETRCQSEQYSFEHRLGQLSRLWWFSLKLDATGYLRTV